MKAAWYERNGAARDVLEVGDMEMPEPAAGEVRVRLVASGVNPSDVKNRRGRPLSAPRIIPHSDGAGIIDAVGPEVSHGRINERVWIWNAQWKRPFGTAAEYVCLPEAQAVTLPGRIGFAEGACLGIPAMTALHAVKQFGPLAGKTLLITGAGSAVGNYATQMAKHAGARVIGTASAAKADHARSGGADFVIDYKNKDVGKVVTELTRKEGVDGIIDMDLSSTGRIIADQIVKPHGLIVTYGSNKPEILLPFGAMLVNSYTLKLFLVYELTAQERQAALAELTTLLEDNILRHAVARRFPLSAIAEAHEAVEAGKLDGNVVVDVG